MVSGMNRMRILQIGDMQNGFLREDGRLFVPGAQEIPERANAFLRSVPEEVFDLVLVVMDTHFPEEYGRSEEARLFPMHCEYGTDDWGLAVDVAGLSNVRYLMKNRFDMWSDPPTEILSFDDPRRRAAYEALYHVVGDPHAPVERTPRDDFVGALLRDGGIEVTMLGVASDYCNRFAMEGWLARGADMTILDDLTKGIEKETRQVLDEHRSPKGGRLRAVTSDAFLRDVKA
jgi:nicotinamidase-related amidase